jgi:crotonobetainyl-CoA:carnitine CoA-transferase CaiB-like acyl-CoA transferase
MRYLALPNLGRQVSLPGIGLRSDQLDLGYRAPAPLVGEHTAEVLRAQLGLSDHELATLAAEGAIGPV